MPEFSIDMTCSDCNTKFPCKEDNTLLFVFVKQRFACFIEAICPQGHGVRSFIDEEDLDMLMKAGYPHVSQDEPPREILQAWDELHNVQPPKLYDLTPRLEKLLDVLKWELDNSSVEDFINTPTTNKIPKKWI